MMQEDTEKQTNLSQAALVDDGEGAVADEVAAAVLVVAHRFHLHGGRAPSAEPRIRQDCGKVTLRGAKAASGDGGYMLQLGAGVEAPHLAALMNSHERELLSHWLCYY